MVFGRQDMAQAHIGSFTGKKGIMNTGKIAYGIFVLLALTLNFSFFLGEIDNPDHHNVYILFAAFVVGLIAMVLKFGERNQVSAVMLATSMVASLQLIAAAIVWVVAEHVSNAGLTPFAMASIVSLSGGALIANLLSVLLMTIEVADLTTG